MREIKVQGRVLVSTLRDARGTSAQVLDQLQHSRIKMQPRDWILNPPKEENLRMQDFLSATQRSTFKSAHKIKRDGKIYDRMKVVWLADQS